MMQINWLGEIIPPRAGRIVAMCNYRDHVLVACEFGLFEIYDDLYTGQWHAVERSVQPGDAAK